ncbi:hypothetical protein JTB14_022929 [Gonioctena quinquepunctata]|nr:hypothetical protein JTB14_022929 [Gonioctena quinquepunctata]
MNTNTAELTMDNLKDLQQKTMKVVIYQNKYFPDKYLEKKTQLVRKILTDERESLNIQNEHLNSEDENIIADQIRSDLLDREKSNIFHYNDIPETLSLPKLIRSETPKIIPTIRRQNLKQFLSLLRNNKKLSKREKALKNCCDHINSTTKPLWTSPSSIMKAVNDCILTRNWNNLTQLLLYMIHLPSDRYKPLIRHLCHIMDRLHPVVQENDLQGQLKLVCKSKRREQ